MKTDPMNVPHHNKGYRPIPQMRLYACAAITVPLFLAAMVGLAATATFYLLKNGTQVMQVTDDDGMGVWKTLDGVPGIPQQLAASADGSVWAKTLFRSGLARYQDGKWDLFKASSFGAVEDLPRHRVVVSGNRLWAVVGDELVEHDSQTWRHHAIPRPAEDYVVAAGARTAWVLGNDGILRVWSQGKWETEKLPLSVSGARWAGDETFRAPTFLATDDGGLWVCNESLWRKRAGQWNLVKMQNHPLVDVDLLGLGGGRIWLRDLQGLLWIDAEEKGWGVFSHEALGLKNDDFVLGVCEWDGRVCVSSKRGVHVLENDKWVLRWPVPEGVYRAGLLATSGGPVYTLAVSLPPAAPLWLVTAVAAFLSVGAILFLWRFLKPDYSPWRTLGFRHLAILACIMIPMILGSVMEISGALLPFLLPLVLAMLFLMVPPLMVVWIVLRERAYHAVELVQFEPVTHAELPPGAVEWFEQNTPAVESLGFRRLGDYRLKQRGRQFARFFLHPDGDVFASIEWLKPSPWSVKRHFCCISVLGDLTYLETGSLPVPNEEFNDDFILMSVHHGTVDEIVQTHRRKLEELTSRRQRLPVVFEDRDLMAVVLHGLKLCYARMKRRGMISVDPYEAVECGLADRVAELEQAEAAAPIG